MGGGPPGKGFRFFFTPLPGFFSPFLHSTYSLSVIKEYLGLGGGPPGFPQGFSCPVVLWILFTPLPGFFSPFLHSTYSLSVIKEYLGLGGGPPGFPQGFSCPVVLWILTPDSRFRLLDFHLLWFAFPKQFDYPSSMDFSVLNPNKHARWFGLFPFRSPLLRKSIFLSLPVAT